MHQEKHTLIITGKDDMATKNNQNNSQGKPRSQPISAKHQV